MKIRPAGAEFFHADGWTDTTNLKVAFRNFANVPKKTSNSEGFCKYDRFIGRFHSFIGHEGPPLFLTSALEGGEGSASRPGRTLPPGKTRYPLYRRLGGPQGPSGQVRKISPPPRFDPRTVQPVGIRYTDYAALHLRQIYILLLSVYSIYFNATVKHCASRFVFYISPNTIRVIEST